ncbi:NAD-dependent epimerase/dehydratase family protein [Ruegeria marina]|uniref:Nucleoside-diphosphate-sugar epimerase n=1 Tax=Ruegeria marina TaxID=639004 RepID=A0A1G6VKS9_9RHOB|nr:NAD(P)-dependent oxidoreductase [Ruegeria marina]SDD54179.1 Nucleoside-diphosphate-sugar epimerase [Ruegeria marina]
MEATSSRLGRVLVTGATGFLGSAVVRTLRSMDADVVGLSRRPAPTENPHVCLDLTQNDVAEVIQRHSITTIIHCAGAIGEPRDAGSWADCLAQHLTATDRLLTASLAQREPPRVVVTSSAAIYAPLEDGQHSADEAHPWRPSGRYGVAKAAATMLAQLEVQRGSPVAIGIPFNVIGPGQPPALVPQTFISQLQRDPDRLVVGDLTPIRDWVDVRDVARALVLLADPDCPTGRFNICTGRGQSVGMILERLLAVSGHAPKVSERSHLAPSAGVSRSVGNPSLLYASTGWEPAYSLDTSLKAMLRFP